MKTCDSLTSLREGDQLDWPITVKEVEASAKSKLPANVYAYFACGSDEQNALARNEDAFHRLLIRPRVLIDVATVDTTTEILGHRSSLPIGIAPSAMQRLAGGDGEIDVAKAAVKMGLNFTLSSQSTTSLEDVARTRESGQRDVLEAPPFWMQLYLCQDVQKSTDLIRRAEARGYQALVLTVDTPVLGNRLVERKTPVILPPGMGLPNLEKTQSAAKLQPSINRLMMNAQTASKAKALRDTAGNSMHSSSLTWASTISFLRSVTKMKIILKGIMTAEDALLAVEHCVDGIVVSNHGGRQLDAACSTIEALPEIAAVVRKRLPVILDGGIRTGSDVFKTLALGADFVLVGRPALWGLAHNGLQGVETTMHILERELSRTMALAGAKSLKDINRNNLGVASRDAFGITKL